MEILTSLQTLSLLNRAWKSGFDVLMLTTDTWQLAWRPTDINIANYTYVHILSLRHLILLTGSDRFYYPGTPGNEIGESDPVFMAKHKGDLARDKGKWIDHSVWHGKAHTWEKIKWLIGEVRIQSRIR